jgi:hypothetical protein
VGGRFHNAKRSSPPTLLHPLNKQTGLPKTQVRTPHTACSCCIYELACSPETLANGLSSSMDLPQRFPESTRW